MTGMAYEAHTWVRGEVISSEKLNRIEQGIEDASAAAVMAKDMQEMRAAFDLLSVQTRALIRALDERVTTLEGA